MTRAGSQEQFKSAVAGWLGVEPDHISLYWKGRVALYTLLKAAGTGPGDEVILPGFTCVVVANAILYLGATPVYADVETDTLQPAAQTIRSLVTERTKAIILQNTFGLSADLDTLVPWARSKGILTLEDCTHGFGGTFQGRPNGTFCDASFFSTQWNKPFSTGIGGFACVTDPMLRNEVEKACRELAHPSAADEFILRTLLLTRRHLLTPATFYTLRNFYRLLSRMGLTIGSSSGGELEDPGMPPGYFKGMGKVQMREGFEALQSLETVLARRKSNGTLFTAFLSGHGKYHVDPAYHANHSFLKYPVLVSDRTAMETAARKAGIELGDWFISPLHPVERHFEKWGLDPASVPVSHHLSRQMMNLPTETRDPNRVTDFLEKNLHLLI